MDKKLKIISSNNIIKNQSLYRSLKHDITDIIDNIITKNNIKISNFCDTY